MPIKQQLFIFSFPQALGTTILHSDFMNLPTLGNQISSKWNTEFAFLWLAYFTYIMSSTLYMLQHVSFFFSFLGLKNIALYAYITFWLSIHLSVGIWVAYLQFSQNLGAFSTKGDPRSSYFIQFSSSFLCVLLTLPTNCILILKQHIQVFRGQ